jgi:hypothetical protein
VAGWKRAFASNASVYVGIEFGRRVLESDRLAVARGMHADAEEAIMRHVVWLLVLVFVVGVISPPAAAAIACAATTAGLVVWFLVWLASPRE